jgi:hypothetical protein
MQHFSLRFNGHRETEKTMSVLKARLVNRHGYYLEVQNNGTISSNVKGDSLNGKEIEGLPFGFVFQLFFTPEKFF